LSRDASVENELVWATAKMPVYVTKTGIFTGTSGDLNTTWKAKTDAVLAAKRKYDFGVKSLAYLTSEY